MKVEALMTKSVRTCRPEDSLDSAARIMWDYDCGCVPVLDATDKVIGVITDRDVCMSAWSQGKRLCEIPVASAMSWRVLTIRPNDTVELAEEVMRDNQVRRLPVVDDDSKLVGLLSIADIAREARRELFLADREVEGIEVAATLAALSAAPERKLTAELQMTSAVIVPPEPKPAAPKPETSPAPRIKLKLD